MGVINYFYRFRYEVLLLFMASIIRDKIRIKFIVKVIYGLLLEFTIRLLFNLGFMA